MYNERRTCLRKFELDQSKIDRGTIQVLLEKLVELQLPRAERMLDRVNLGEILSEYDLEFLETISVDITTVQPLLHRYPQYEKLDVKVMSLYTEIITKGVKNDKQSS